MFSRKWIVAEQEEEIILTLQNELNIKPLTAKILYNRGLRDKDSAQSFLSAGTEIFHDPMMLRDMDKAVARIKYALDNAERICIYGDYDVDGVSATVVLYSYLLSKGGICSYYIPERLSEGYGLNVSALQAMKGSVDLLITVDTGITAVTEAKELKKLGIDLVITDHHTCRDVLPDAAAVINPQRKESSYPFKGLAGVGVVFKLLCAMEGKSDDVFEKYADLIAIGTIADVMPLVDENRVIAKAGVRMLSRTTNIGLHALMKESGILKEAKKNASISSSAIGFNIAPRLNAAGRIAKAQIAAELLLTKDGSEASRIAALLCEMNKTRQATEQNIFRTASDMVDNSYSSDSFLVLSSPDWHQGVIGICASRVSEKYNCPCILFSENTQEGICKGSGRSVKGLSLIEALSECSDLLLEYGGHEMAAGLSVASEKIDQLRERLCAFADKRQINISEEKKIYLDCEVNLDELDCDSLGELMSLEPFGQENTMPLLVLRGVRIKHIEPLTGGRHIRFDVIDDNARSISAIYFGMSRSSFVFDEGSVCDIVFNANLNEYRGVKEPQLVVKNVRHIESEYACYKKGFELFECLHSNIDRLGDMGEEIIPTVEDFRVVFKYLRDANKHNVEKFSVISICKTVPLRNCLPDALCTAKIILYTLQEKKLITLSFFGNDIFLCRVLNTKERVNVMSSEYLISIEERLQKRKEQ